MLARSGKQIHLVCRFRQEPFVGFQPMEKTIKKKIARSRFRSCFTLEIPIDASIRSVVFAKVHGHRHWPAVITEVLNRANSVLFYGTKQIAKVFSANIVQFCVCKIQSMFPPVTYKLYDSFLKALGEIRTEYNVQLIKIPVFVTK